MPLQWRSSHWVPTHCLGYSWRQCPPKSPWHEPAVGQSCHLVTLLSLLGGLLFQFRLLSPSFLCLIFTSMYSFCSEGYKEIYIRIYSLVSIRDQGFGFTRKLSQCHTRPNNKEMISNPSCITCSL